MTETMTPALRKQLSAWYTPAWVADGMWARAKTHNPTYLLEPSAGTGSLLMPVDDHVHVTAFDIERAAHAPYLGNMEPAIEVFYQDFLTTQWDYPTNGAYLFDVGLGNPPFENNQDLDFVCQMFRLCAVVVVHVRVQFLHRTECYKRLWSRPDVCLSWRADCIPRPRFGGKYNPMDEYVCLELVHGPQTAHVEYARIINPKLLVECAQV